MRVEMQDNGRPRFVRERWTEWLVVTITQGARIPPGYGVAWLQSGQAAVCLPLGVNAIAGFARRVYLGLVTGIRPSAIERMLITQRQVADREGYDRAVQDTQRQLEARFHTRLAAIDSMRVPTEDGESLVDDETLTRAATELGNVAADGLEIETWTDEERVFFMAAMELARRKGDAIFFACQDPRCQSQPILARVNGEGGFSLACFHKRRWLPDPKGPIGHISRRQLAKLGVH